jgi:hypothetical protein
VRPYLEKNPSQKRAGGMAQDLDPEFKPHHRKSSSSSSSSLSTVRLHEPLVFFMDHPELWD